LLRCPSGISFENRRRNLGSLLLAYARETSPISDVVVQGMSFVDVGSGAAHLERVELKSCQFIDVDLSGVRLDDCRVSSCEFDGITLDEASHLGVTGLVPGVNVKRVDYGSSGVIYDPAQIAAVLEELGATLPQEAGERVSYSEHAQELIALLEKVARAYHRTTIIYDTDDRRHQAILSSPHWPELRALLIDYGVIGDEQRETRGANVTAYRLRANPDELLTGDVAEGHSSTAGLWAALRSA